VILLDHRVHEQLSTRRMRSSSTADSRTARTSIPFLIDDGISVLTGDVAGLSHRVSSRALSTGSRARRMLGGGYYRGSSVLVSGPRAPARST
jgi:circadian clock protein KaiC